MKMKYNQSIQFVVNHLSVETDILSCVVGLSSFPIDKLCLLPTWTLVINKSKLHILRLSNFTDFSQILGTRISRTRSWSGDDSDGGWGYHDGD
jgi:hypothetical protein